MLLAVCIPSYNRKELLQQAVESILNQQEEVQIVISDNGSTDGTEEYVKDLQKKHKNILYFKWEQTVSCGENLLKVVEIAPSKYCWLLSDDDQLLPKSIQKVKNILEKYPELTGLSVNVEGFDRFFQKKRKIRYSHSLLETTYFSSFSDCYQQLGAWFGFWSAQIVNKKKWMEAISFHQHEEFLGYHHLYLICKMLEKHPSWFFIFDKCVGYRSDNESFSQEYGRLKRYEIDLIAYREIGGRFFGKKSKEQKKICKRVLHAYSFWQILSMKLENISHKELFKVFKVSFSYYKPYLAFWIKMVPLFLMPNKILLIIRQIYRKKWSLF